MKAKAYLRVAKTRRGARVMASSRANRTPIEDSYNQPYPTVSFAVIFEIPDEAFKAGERVVAEVAVPPEHVYVNVETVDE